MEFGKLFGWGVVLYALLFLLWSFFAVYGFANSAAARPIAFLVLLIAAFIAGRSLHMSSWKDIVPYSLGWALIMAILDAAFSVPLRAWHVFSEPSVWVGVALVILTPLLAAQRLHVADRVSKWET